MKPIAYLLQFLLALDAIAWSVYGQSLLIAAMWLAAMVAVGMFWRRFDSWRWQ